MAEKYTSIAQLNLGRQNSQPISGGSLTPIEWETNNDIDANDIPKPIDTKYFNVVLPTSDIQINVPCKLDISAICSVSGLVGTGLNEYQLQMYRDVGDGAGFKLIRELVPIDGVILAFGSGLITYKYTIDVDFDFGVDPGHIFQLNVGRNAGAGDAEVISRGACIVMNVVKLLF